MLHSGPPLRGSWGGCGPEEEALLSVACASCPGPSERPCWHWWYSWVRLEVWGSESERCGSRERTSVPMKDISVGEAEVDC